MGRVHCIRVWICLTFPCQLLPSRLFHHNLIGEEPSSEGRGCGLYADVAGAGLLLHTEGEDIGHVCTLGIAVHAAELPEVHAVGGDADDIVLRIEDFGTAHLHEVGLYGAEAFHAAEVDGGIEACVLASDESLPASVAVVPSSPKPVRHGGIAGGGIGGGVVRGFGGVGHLTAPCEVLHG